MDILVALKQEKRELELKLGQVEKAIMAYSGDKKPAAKKPNGNGHTAPEAAASPAKLPDRILKLLLERGGLPASDIADALAAPVGPVATTCSRLVRAGRLKKAENNEGATVYLCNHESEDESPFKK